MSDELRAVEDVRSWLAGNVYHPVEDDDAIGLVGLEAEFLPFWVTGDGRPAARLALVEIVGLVDGIAAARRNPDRGDRRPSWLLGTTLVTEEPGAQLELAGAPEQDAATAVARLERAIATVSRAFVDEGAALAAAGLDAWSGPENIPVQLEIPRYEAMSTYFARRGGSQGHLLMCASCSLQINVDLGPPAVARERCLLANLAAPMLVAAFSASPTAQAANGRAMGWRGLDPTRTGVSPAFVAGSDDPLEHALADALRADVLLVERDAAVHAGRPGWSFQSWLADPHPVFGRPTADDLATHLTTLFPEARLRGYLEVRGVDMLPGRWRAAAVCLVVGLLYDDGARRRAVELLGPHRRDVPALLARAAREGMGDRLVARLTAGVLEEALAGARRLGDPLAADGEAFLERFTRLGRQPADELRPALEHDPKEAFAWARC